MKILVCLCALVAFQPLLVLSSNIHNVVRPLLALIAWNSMTDLVGSEPLVRSFTWQSQPQVKVWRSGWKSASPDIFSSITKPVLGPMMSYRSFGPVQGLFSTLGGFRNNLQSILQPLYALTLKAKMMKGIGGISVATEGDRAFLIANGNRYECQGQIQGPKCLGTLLPFRINNQRDLCYAKNYARAGDNICLAESPISVGNIDGRTQCNTADNAPVLMLPADQHQGFCGSALPWKVHYIYYGDPYSPQQIAIPNDNIDCLNQDAGICEFEGDLSTASMDIQGMMNMASM